MLFVFNSSGYLVRRFLVSHKVWTMDMESSSTIVLHSLLKDLEIRRLGIQGVVSWMPGKSATQFISYSITEVTMMMPLMLEEALHGVGELPSLHVVCM